MSKKATYFWEGTYPLIIYTFLLSFLVEIFVKYTPLSQLGTMPIQATAKLICIFPMLYFFNKAPKRQAKTKNKIKDAFFILILAICLNIAFNNIISLTPLKEWSAGYGEVETTIYSATLFWQVLSAGILAPILEELVFRGILFGNYRTVMGPWPAIVVSAVVFGAMHYNIVQFVYAFLLGIFFAYLLEKTGELWTCILAHIAANLFSLFATRLGIIEWMFSDVVICLVSGIAALVVAIVLLVRWKKL